MYNEKFPMIYSARGWRLRSMLCCVWIKFIKESISGPGVLSSWSKASIQSISPLNICLKAYIIFLKNDLIMRVCSPYAPHIVTSEVPLIALTHYKFYLAFNNQSIWGFPFQMDVSSLLNSFRWELGGNNIFQWIFNERFLITCAGIIYGNA